MDDSSTSSNEFKLGKKKQTKETVLVDSSSESEAEASFNDANDSVEEDIKGPAPARPRKRAKPTIFDVDDDDDCDEPMSENATVSVETLKHKILGRSIQSYSQSPRLKAPSDDATSYNLRNELSCVICHEIFHQPVSLHCGHSFCGPCLYWWLEKNSVEEDHENYGNCPTCRSALLCEGGMLGVNTALRACVQTLFEEDYRRRIRAEEQSERRATAGENGGAHQRGYEILTATLEDRWKVVGMFQVRRSTVLDTSDQRMQLTLSLNGLESNTAIFWKGGNLEISMLLLMMEEDEVADSGFPTTVSNPDDEHVIATEDRFSSIVEVVAEVNSSPTGSQVPVSRRVLGPGGGVQFSIDMVNNDLQSGCILIFCHHETGAELQLRVPPYNHKNVKPSSQLKTEQKNGANRNDSSRFLKHAHDLDDENEVEDSGEDDGFIVDDDEEVSVDADEVCALCEDGGDLLVCDGGDVTKGCSRNFHITCIKRTEVPSGDWVCMDCAADFGLSGTDIQGHEFRSLVDIEYSRSPSTSDHEVGDEQVTKGRFSPDSIAEGGFSDDDAIDKNDDSDEAGDY